MPPTVVKHILGQAALQLSLLAAVLGPWGLELAGGERDVQMTLVFNTFVWLQLFNQVGGGLFFWGLWAGWRGVCGWVCGGLGPLD